MPISHNKYSLRAHYYTFLIDVGLAGRVHRRALTYMHILIGMAGF